MAGSLLGMVFISALSVFIVFINVFMLYDTIVI